MIDPLGENEAVATACVCGDDIGHDLLVSADVCCEVLVDRGDPAGLGWVGVAEVSVVGCVDVQCGCGSRCVQTAG